MVCTSWINVTNLYIYLREQLQISLMPQGTRKRPAFYTLNALIFIAMQVTIAIVIVVIVAVHQQRCPPSLQLLDNTAKDYIRSFVYLYLQSFFLFLFSFPSNTFPRIHKEVNLRFRHTTQTIHKCSEFMRRWRMLFLIQRNRRIRWHVLMTIPPHLVA